MAWFRVFTTIAIAALLASGSSAESLRDRLSEGAAKAAGAVKKTAKHVDATIDSTVELARKDVAPEITRAKLDAMADETLAGLFAQNPGAQDLFQQSAGYAVFDTRRATMLGVVAGFGKGVAVSRETGARTYMNMGTGGVGLAFGIGGFESQVVILFQDAARLQDFVVNGYDATAEAAAVAGDDRTEQTIRFVDGRSIFLLGKRGWRVGASAAGTKYWAAPDLN